MLVSDAKIGDVVRYIDAGCYKRIDEEYIKDYTKGEEYIVSELNEDNPCEQIIRVSSRKGTFSWWLTIKAFENNFLYLRSSIKTIKVYE